MSPDDPDYAPITHLIEPKGDLRWGGPTTVCMCGCRMFIAIVALDPDERTIGMYFTEAICGNCGCLVVLATPVDMESPNDRDSADEQY